MLNAARRSLQPAIGASSLVAAARIVLGPPRLAVAAGYFEGGVPTIAQAEAVMALLTWIVIVAVLVASFVALMRALRHGPSTRTPSRALLFMLASAVLLVVAVVHRSAGETPTGCCSSTPSLTQEAADLAR